MQSRWTLLLSIAKLQNLKAIHNTYFFKSWWFPVVINRKTTKFESNSQHKTKIQQIYNSCYQSQTYKIWKQVTTIVSGLLRWLMLLSITKLQNLKAIHNLGLLYLMRRRVVINRKTTRFENNSQYNVMIFICFLNNNSYLCTLI